MTKRDTFSDYETEDQKPDFESTLVALKNGDPGKPDTLVYYGLSGMDAENIISLRPIWEQLSAGYRRNVLRELIEASEADIQLEYRELGMFALRDADTRVREAAIELLWEDQSLELLNELVEMAIRDESREVRAAAVSALGRFILAGEIGDLPEEQTLPAREAAIFLLTANDEDVLVRRRALESISNCVHEIVPNAIKVAYQSDDQEMQVSALYAMGRTYDQQWAEIVIEELDSDDPEKQYEAAKSAGELELIDSVPKLSQLALGDDREIQLVAIWSLGEIGGKESMRVLEFLLGKADEDEDDDLEEAVEDAIGNASLNRDNFANVWLN
jgi:HEAT repeat protein